MPLKKLTDYLDGNNIRYVTVNHSPAYTAQEIAAIAHIPGKELAKTVMVIIDGKLSMAVLPASCKIDFEQLKKAIGVDNIELAGEMEFKDIFPDCEIGAMPPFGNLFNMDVYVARKLTEDTNIAFNAGSHTQRIKMSYKDYESLVDPKVVPFSLTDT